MKKIIALEIICALLVILFMYTAISKFVAFEKFAYDMHNQPFPHWLSDTLIWTLPLTESIVALLLVFPRTRMASLYSSLVLMSLFTIYTALVLFHFFPRVPCSCGGVIKHLSWKEHAVFNLFFVAISIAGIILHKQLKKQSANTSFAVA